MNKPNPGIILRGWYGRGNLGDEMMLIVLVNSIRTRLPGCTLQVFSARPEVTAQEHDVLVPNPLRTGGIPFLSTTIRRILIAIREDVFLIGGGNILTGEHNWLHLIEYWLLVYLTRIFGKGRAVLIGVGAAKLNHPVARWLAREIVNNSEISWLRDNESYELLASLGASPERMKIGSDLVYLINRYIPLTNSRSCSKSSANAEPKIGVSLLPYYTSVKHDRKLHEEFVQLWASILDRIVQRGNAEITFFSMQRPISHSDKHDDSKLYSEIRNTMMHSDRIELFDPEYSLKSFVVAMSLMDYNIGMRLHFCMLSFMLGVEVMGVGYSPKIRSLFRSMGCESQCFKFSKPGAYRLGEALLGEIDNTKKCASSATIHAVNLRHTRTVEMMESVLDMICTRIESKA